MAQSDVSNMAQSVDRTHCWSTAVLVVDDTDAIREFLKATLSRWGYFVDLAEHGVEALRCLSRRAYDVILTDIEMPQLDGVSLWRRAVEAGHPGAWILMTGSTGPRCECAIPILRKPLRLQELQDALKRAAFRPSMRDQSSINSNRE